jgi:hypothetical protein
MKNLKNLILGRALYQRGVLKEFPGNIYYPLREKPILVEIKHGFTVVKKKKYHLSSFKI